MSKAGLRTLRRSSRMLKAAPPRLKDDILMLKAETGRLQEEWPRMRKALARKRLATVPMLKDHRHPRPECMLTPKGSIRKP